MIRDGPASSPGKGEASGRCLALFSICVVPHESRLNISVPQWLGALGSPTPLATTLAIPLHAQLPTREPVLTGTGTASADGQPRADLPMSVKNPEVCTLSFNSVFRKVFESGYHSEAN